MNYTQLTSLPLFTGISGDDLAIVMDRVELIDVELMAGEVFVRQDDVCSCLTILKEGTMRRIYKSDYTVTEYLQGTRLIEPGILYGLNQRHASTWTADTSCHLTLISKDDVRQTLMNVPIWRINFINLLSTLIQRGITQNHPRKLETLEEQIMWFFTSHRTARDTRLTFNITMELLGKYVGASRRSVGTAVNRLATAGQIKKDISFYEVSNEGRK